MDRASVEGLDAEWFTRLETDSPLFKEVSSFITALTLCIEGEKAKRQKELAAKDKRAKVKAKAEGTAAKLLGQSTVQVGRRCIRECPRCSNKLSTPKKHGYFHTCSWCGNDLVCVENGSEYSLVKFNIG